jgi:hypothetical protein
MGLHAKSGRALWAGALRERSAQVLVDHFLEWPASAACLSLQPRGDVIFKCQGGSHIKTL